jgi:hypothetical protein
MGSNFYHIYFDQFGAFFGLEHAPENDFQDSKMGYQNCLFYSVTWQKFE